MAKGNSWNFAQFFSGAFNTFMDSVAARMSSISMSFTSPVVNGRVTNSNQDVNKIFNLDQDIYFEYLKGYSFLNALVKAYLDPVSEVVSGENIKVTCKAGDQYTELANKGIEEFGLKDYIVKHLEEMIRRGSFTSFIDINDKCLKDTICPYKNGFMERGGNLLMVEVDKAKFPFYEMFIYYFRRNLKNILTVEEVKKMKLFSKAEFGFNDTQYTPAQLKEILTKDPNFLKRRKAKERLIADVQNFVGQSILSDYLRELFNLFLREYIFDQMSMLEYLRSNIIKTTVSSQRIDVRKATEVANQIESLLNEDNATMITAYQDPNQMLSAINDRLLSRNRVLPESPDYAALEELKIPDIQGMLDKLKADIETDKKDLANMMSIPEELLVGTAATNNRWETISKSQRFSDAIIQVLTTISLSIKNFCCSYVYLMTGQYIPASMWEHEYKTETYLQSFSNKSKINILMERLKDFGQLIFTIDEISQLPVINQEKYLQYIQDEVKKADSALSECLLVNNPSEGQSVQIGVNARKKEEGTGTGFSLPKAREEVQKKYLMLKSLVEEHNK
jgi:hypothetical protein